MIQPPKILKHVALFTDIHFGKKSNDRRHNQDCVEFVAWFCDLVRANKQVTHIAFLGDWFESRSAINIETMDFSYAALKLLDELGLPVFFMVGNHDLHRRTTRDVHSVRIFNELKNFTVVDKAIEYDGCLFVPFLFDHEYKALEEHNDKWAFFGHFEFCNFYITGYNTLMEHGPDHRLLHGPKKIFSGHYHKRQQKDNVVYIGNTFPMDAGDAGDYDRGACIYDVAADKVQFINWDDCPTYYKTTLSEIIAGSWKPRPKARVKCIVNLELDYTEAQELREAMIVEKQLRDLVLEEDRAVKQGLLEGDTSKVTEVHDMQFNSIDELVVNSITEGMKDQKQDKYNVDTLVSLYKDVKLEVVAKE